MIVELDILGKDSDSILVEERTQKQKPLEPEKPRGFVYEEPMLEIVQHTRV